MIPVLCQHLQAWGLRHRFRRCLRGVSPRARAGLAVVLLLAPLAGRAEGMALGLRYGEDGSDYNGSGISLRFHPWWWKEYGNWSASLSPAVEFTRFRYRGDGIGARSLSEIGGIGMFRFSRQAGWFRPYAEAGLGMSLFSRQDLGEKVFSTAFQFSEHLGLGLGVGEHWALGYRFSHYSNADIQTPNKGLDVQQVMLSFSF